MTRTMKDLVADALSRVGAVSPPDAEQAVRAGDFTLDVREPGELEPAGGMGGALHVPRGILETRADLATDPDLIEGGLGGRRSAVLLVES
jgi:rhodanese-related sulfurtransferase